MKRRDWLKLLPSLAVTVNAQTVTPEQPLKITREMLQLALQLASDPAPYVTALRERGLLVVGAGGNVIRVLPPLIATAAELARSVDILRAVLAAKA